MIKVIAENVEFIYDNKFSYFLLEKKFVFSHTYDALDFINVLELEKVCRVSISQPLFNKGGEVIDYLFWINNQNLLDIDNKVLDSEYTDIDFKYSIRTGFIKNLECPTCKNNYMGLVVDPSLYYINNHNIGREKIKLLKESNKLLKCPNCNSDFRIFIVHIFN